MKEKARQIVGFPVLLAVMFVLDAFALPSRIRTMRFRRDWSRWTQHVSSFLLSCAVCCGVVWMLLGICAFLYPPLRIIGLNPQRVGFVTAAIFMSLTGIVWAVDAWEVRRLGPYLDEEF